MALTAIKQNTFAQPELETLISEGRSTITPELAQRILTERNYARQRPIETSHVALLAELMRRGEFQSGRQIWFGLADGKLHLIDGQHRLHGLIDAGIPAVFDVQFMPLRGEEELNEAYISFDRIGRPRSTPEMLNALGVSERHGVGKMMSLSVFQAAVLIHFNFAPPHHTADPIAIRSDAERMRYAEPFWGVAAEYERLIGKASGGLRKRLRASQVCAVALITLQHQREQALLFWGGLASNDGLRKGDPRHTLINWLADHMFDRRGFTGATAAALAWNAFYEHRKIETLKVNSVAGIRISGTPVKGAR